MLSLILLVISVLAVAADNDRWIYCHAPECNCHGGMPNEYIYTSGCKASSGQMWDLIQFNSLQADLGGGVATMRFYNSTDCSGEDVFEDTLNENSGKYTTITIDGSVLEYVAYCYGDDGPCSC